MTDLDERANHVVLGHDITTLPTATVQDLVQASGVPPEAVHITAMAPIEW